jgi:hypothetical protein
LNGINALNPAEDEAVIMTGYGRDSGIRPPLSINQYIGHP